MGEIDVRDRVDPLACEAFNPQTEPITVGALAKGEVVVLYFQDCSGNHYFPVPVRYIGKELSERTGQRRWWRIVEFMCEVRFDGTPAGYPKGYQMLLGPGFKAWFRPVEPVSEIPSFIVVQI